ncbi:MAG: haloalkane dehalogenase, partial [Actinobacteria bacterium]|nr:haloalkane dehalogenase [Actinomycetota bacterium]
PFLCTYSDSDPITKGADAVFIAKVPGAAGQPHVTIEGGGHFLQEDCGPQLAGVLVDWMNGLD